MSLEALEDLYKDLGIIDGDDILKSPLLPAFNFPDLPPAFTTDHDKENWKTLGDALNKSSKQVALLDEMVKDLVTVDDRFRYIGNSVKWLKLELERMCELPPLSVEQNDGSSFSNEEAAGEEVERTPISDNLGATANNISEAPVSEADQKEEASAETQSVKERMFKPSEIYDWSEIEEDVQLLQEIVIMNPLMAIYEILDAKPGLDAILDHLFAQPPLVDWDGTNDDALLEVLNSLTASFLEWQRSQLEEPSRTRESTTEETGRIDSSDPTRTYPSPRITDPHEIRILELLPGSIDDPIQCLLSIEHLWDDPRYKALSYAWGSATDLRSIQLNEASFEITTNLEVALRHLRNEIEPQRLWIDALCINQKDPIEKQAQVQLMSEIYPAADRVLCWLGPEADDSDFVMQCLQKRADTLNGDYSSDFRSVHDIECNHDDRFVRGLSLLESRDWWSRLWTCQEYALTLKDPLMICGIRSISWSSFRRVAQRKTLPPLTSIFSPRVSDATEIVSSDYWEGTENLYRSGAAYIIRNKTGFFGPSRSKLDHPISSMAILTRRHQCSDPRDKLYAILSFFSEPYRVLLPPKYMQSVEMVFQKYTAAVLMVSRSGSAYSQLGVRGDSSSTFPSWTFELSPQAVEGNSHPQVNPVQQIPADATKGRSTQCVAIGPRLLIRGVVVDDVRTVIEVPSGDAADATSLAKVFESLSELQSAAMNTKLEKIAPNDPISRFQHLRTVDSVLEIASYGVYDKDTFHSNAKASMSAEDKNDVEVTAIATSDKLTMDFGNLIHPPPLAESEPVDLKLQVLFHILTGRRLFTTESGFFGISGNMIQEGDLLVLLFGFKTPMVLRQHGNHFSLIGAARVGGITQGQLMEFVDDGSLVERTFEIR